MPVTSGVPFPQQPVVDLVDFNGVRVVEAAGVVTASVSRGSGVLFGDVVIQAVAGRAAFARLCVTFPPEIVVASEDHQLTFSADGLAVAVSNLFAVQRSGGPGPVASRLVFVSVPVAVTENALLASVLVRAESASGGLATGFSGVITLTVESVAVISATVRDVTLRATADGVTPAISTVIRVTAS